jgi:AcrR family transcriptional regulator
LFFTHRWRGTNMIAATGSTLRIRHRPRTAALPARRACKREKLLQHAREAFALYGYYGAQLNAISLRAGLRKSTLFHYFTDKAALYEEAVCDRLRDIVDDLDRAAGYAEDAEHRVTLLVAHLCAALDQDPALARLILRELVDVPPAVPNAGDALRQMGALFAHAIAGSSDGQATDAAIRVITMLCLRRVDAVGPRASADAAAQPQPSSTPDAYRLLAAVQQIVGSFPFLGV